MKGPIALLLPGALLLGFGVALSASAPTSPAWSTRPQIRILHFGDSHVAAVPFASAVRSALAERFGAGEGGIVLPDLPGASPQGGPRLRFGAGWKVVRGKHADSGLAGLAGGWAEGSAAGSAARLEGPFAQGRLLLLKQPGGGTATIRLDGRPIQKVRLSAAEPSLETVSVRSAGPGEHRVEVVAAGDGPVRLLGVVLGSDRSGAVYMPIGVNGARASSLLRLSEPLLARQLAEVDPDLVILAFGTNETWTTGLEPGALEEQISSVVLRIRRSVPRAAVLVAGPPDQARRSVSGTIESVPQREMVSRVFEEAARNEGASFVDLAEAMGGSGSAGSWKAARPSLMQEDLIHFTVPGYLRLAQIFSDAIRGRETPRLVLNRASPERAGPTSSGDVRIASDARGRIILTNAPVPASDIPRLGRTRSP